MNDEVTELNGVEAEIEVPRAKRGPKPKAIKIELTDEDAPESVEAPVKAEVRRLPVKLLRNYRPFDPGFTIGGRVPTAEEREKVRAGSEIELEVSEAQSVCQNGIAVRNDPFA